MQCLSVKFAFSEKIANFLRASIAFSVYKQNFTLYNLKIGTFMNEKPSMFVILGEAIICLFLYNLHDLPLNNWKEKCF